MQLPDLRASMRLTRLDVTEGILSSDNTLHPALPINTLSHSLPIFCMFNRLTMSGTTATASPESSAPLRYAPGVLTQWTIGMLVAHAVSAAMTVAVLTAAWNQPSRQAAMAFYGVYHRNPMNQLIHFFGVPAILWTGFVFGAHLPWSPALMVPRVAPPLLPDIPKHYVTYATVWCLFYTFYYIKIDPVGGLLYAPFLYGMYASAVRWTLTDQTNAKHEIDKPPPWTGTGKVLWWALLVHLLAWYVQIHPGHKMFEGAQPALLQSLGASFSSAPLFAFYEGVWFLGLRHTFREQVRDLVQQYTIELCQGGSTMRACTV